jgi:hypothetical protein
MPKIATRGKNDQAKQDAIRAILPKSLKQLWGLHKKEDETWEAFEKRIQNVADAYNKALTSTPNPDTLEPVDYDDPKLRGKDGHADFTLIDAIYARNEATIQAWEDAAKKTRAWMGRTLTDGVADGHATYVVVKEGKSTVRIQHCKGLGDDYYSRHWGEACSIKKTEACSFMEWTFGEKRVLPYDMKEGK